MSGDKHHPCGNSCCPVCPHCGTPVYHLAGADQGGRVTCHVCRGEFRWAAAVQVTYSCEKLPSEERT